MGWFDSQLRDRERLDNETFTDSFIKMAGAVMGTGEYERFRDKKEQTKSAIEDILKYYHHKASALPDEVEDVYDQLDYLIRPFGLMYRNVTLREGWSQDGYGPMLATFKESQMSVALIPGKFGGYYCLLEDGKKRAIHKKDEELFEREAICFYNPFPLKKLKTPDLMKYIFSILSVGDLAWILVISAAVTLLGLLLPNLTNQVLKSAEVINDGSILFPIFAFIATTTVSSVICSSAKTAMTERVQMKMSLSVEAATMMRVLSLPVDFFKDYSAGELSSRVGYINVFCEMLMSTIFSVGVTSLFSLAYVSQIKNFAPALVVPALVIIILTVVFSVVTTLVEMKIREEAMQISTKESGLNYALIGGIQKIKLAGAEKRAFSKWADLYAQEAKLSYNPPIFIKIQSVFSLVISFGGMIVLYYLAIKNNMTAADYYSFNVAYGMVSAAFMSLAGVTTTVAQFKPILNMIRPILEVAPEIGEGKKIITKLRGSIELNHVTFRYNDDSPTIINDLSVKIDAGQYVAIVGRTGCGKSTLMRLLLGFEKPVSGSIYYDQRDINTLDLRSLRQKIGVVIQNGKLMQGSIYENIVVSAPFLTHEDAWEAARLAGMDKDIEEMPMGMFTMVSEGAGGISGGQKQRLMIARAIAPKPRILMFDEATSALDNITQKKVSTALDELKCTRIVIAHRLSTIKQCDRILVLDGGKIIEDGKYDELIEKGGFFADLVEHQRVD